MTLANSNRRVIVNIERNQIDNREIERKEAFVKLSSEFTLPSPSGTVMELLKLCNSEDSSLNEISDLIQTDPSLSAEIIKYANSSLMATGIQVASVKNATVRLGMKNVVNLALSLSVLADNRNGSCEQFAYGIFWQNSLAEALAVREISKLSKEFDPDELFVCGLLAHIGQLSLATIFPAEYGQLLIDRPPNTPLKADELASFGIDSAELTTELLLSWGIPPHYALATGFHEDFNCVELGTGTTQRLAVFLYLADNIAKMCQSDAPLFEVLEDVVNTAEKFGIAFGSFPDVFSNIVESWHEHGKMFNIQTSESYSYD